MLLHNRYYRIISKQTNGTQGVYTVSLVPDFEVYQGHFPNDPVCPGVCNIEMIKECAIELIGRNLTITSIKQCRLTAIATPVKCPRLQISVNATLNTDNSFLIIASIKDDNQEYMAFKGTLKEIK